MKKIALVALGIEERIKGLVGSEGFEEVIEPIGLCYVAGVAQKAGYDVTLIQQTDETDEEIADRVRELSPDVVGFTAVTTNYSRTRNLAQRIKSELGNVITVAGGIHASTDTKNVASDFDYVVKGEGEITFVELLGNLDCEDENMREVRGIAYQEDGKFVFTGRRSRIQNLDELVVMREGLPFDKYNVVMPPGPANIRNVASMEFSRGCKMDCSFCTNQEMWREEGKRAYVVSRSPKNVVDEMQYLHEQKGVDYIFFHDEDFTNDREAVKEFCEEIIERGLNVKWAVMGRVTDVLRKNDVDSAEELLTLMKQAGCSQIGYGVESGDPVRLKNIIKKGISLDRAKDVFEMTYEAGIVPTAYFVIGGPGETEESLAKTVEYARNLKALRYRFAHTYPFFRTRDRYQVDRHNLWISEEHKKPERATGSEQVIKLPDNFHERIPNGLEIVAAIYNSSEYRKRLNDFEQKNPNYDWKQWKTDILVRQ